jgi:glycosyltransferase involved in cell wall biosynthesis
MVKLPITVTIITLNERENLPRAIDSVRWAAEVLVVDSGSTDGTVELARQMGARVLENPWTGYGQQKNFAQTNASHDWVLNIDADECVSEALAQEIRENLQTVERESLAVRGFAFPRKTYYLGRWIKHGGWYPNVLTRMADRRHARWSEPFVHEELIADGETRVLSNPLDHYAFTSIHEQITTNLRFSRLGSEDLKRRGESTCLLKLLLKPLGKFVETYFLKRGFLDGLPGFIISVNAAHSMFLKYAYLHEERIRRVE